MSRRDSLLKARLLPCRNCRTFPLQHTNLLSERGCSLSGPPVDSPARNCINAAGERFVWARTLKSPRDSGSLLPAGRGSANLSCSCGSTAGVQPPSGSSNSLLGFCLLVDRAFRDPSQFFVSLFFFAQGLR